MGLPVTIVGTLLLLFTVISGQLEYDFDDDVEEDGFGRFPRGIDDGLNGDMDETVIPPIASSTVSSAFPASLIPDACDTITAPVNGYQNVVCTDETCTNLVLQFSCEDDYKLTGDAEITCINGQLGSFQPPVCVRKTCPLPVIPNGQYNGGLNQGDSGNVTCNNNFELSSGDDGTVECQNEQWSTFPTCNFVSCGEPVAPVGGTVENNCDAPNCTASYSCGQGQTPSPASDVLCIADFGWEHDVECKDEVIEEQSDGTITFEDPVPFEHGIKEAMEAWLFSYFENALGDDLQGVVVTLDPDTNSVNYTVLTTDDDETKRKLAVAMSGLSGQSGQAFVDLLGQQLVISQTTVLGLDVNLDVDACDIYREVYNGDCPEDTTCTPTEDTIQCIAVVEDDDGNDIPLIVGLAVGVPLLALGIAGTLYCCCICVRGAGAEEDEEPVIHWNIGWLPRYAHIPVRLNTKSPRLPGYFYTPASENSSPSSSSDSYSNSKSTTSGHTSAIHRSDNMAEANFSWDTLFNPVWGP